MGITLYTAPGCLRCSVVKNFMTDKGITWEQFDFKADKDIFNTFYRTNRPRIYRNPEGVEFPLFDDGTVIKQGSGEIIAYLLAGHELECAVERSDLLHGWISGLNLSACPPKHDDNFLVLVHYLAKGGLKVHLRTDGRRPDLLEKLLASGDVTRLALDIVGPADVYPTVAGGSLAPEDLKKTIALVRSFADHRIQLYLAPLPGGAGYLTPDQGGEAAKMLLDAGGDIKLPLRIYLSDKTAGGVAPLAPEDLLAYRNKARRSLVTTDIAKPEEH